MFPLTLKLDKTGYPQSWLSIEQAALYYSKGMVLWEMGSVYTKLRGGTGRHGMRSMLDVNSIIAVAGKPVTRRSQISTFNRRMLFQRDRYVCAYCGYKLEEMFLEVEHIIPLAKGGATVWTNLVTACRACNARKDCRTPEEAGMPLLYVPYVPNKYESFILVNRRILGDQMDFLLSGVPKHSRLL